MSENTKEPTISLRLFRAETFEPIMVEAFFERLYWYRKIARLSRSSLSILTQVPIEKIRDSERWREPLHLSNQQKTRIIRFLWLRLSWFLAPDEDARDILQPFVDMDKEIERRRQAEP